MHVYCSFGPRLTHRSETHFKIGELTYKLFDVGGQRSERRKWLNIFDSVSALVFLIAINECKCHLMYSSPPRDVQSLRGRFRTELTCT